MPQKDEEIIKKFRIKPTDRILDVGGSMNQHKGIRVDTLVDAIRPEESKYYKSNLLAKNFVRLDLNSDKFPFRDKEFDFCLCTHTLEDLPYPFLAIKEMSRVAKRGYIATPSFGQDIVFDHVNFTNWRTGARRVPGLAHHKWLFYEKEGVMNVVPKNYPLLYSSEFQFVKWKGDPEFQYPWAGKINFKEIKDYDFEKLILEYRHFVMKNRKKLIKFPVAAIYLDNPVYYLKELIKSILGRGYGFD